MFTSSRMKEKCDLMLIDADGLVCVSETDGDQGILHTALPKVYTGNKHTQFCGRNKKHFDQRDQRKM